MSTPQTNLDELKEELLSSRIRLEKRNGKFIIRNLTRNTSTEISGVNIYERSSHIIIKDDHGNRITLPLDRRIIFERSATWILTLLLGLGTALLFDLESDIHHIFHNKTSEPIIDQRLKELALVRDAIQRVDEYARDQESELLTLNESVSTKKQEEQNLETILATDKQQVDALLAYSSRSNIRDKWVDRGVSFFIGVISGNYSVDKPVALFVFG